MHGIDMTEYFQKYVDRAPQNYLIVTDSILDDIENRVQDNTALYIRGARRMHCGVCSDQI
jgi:hypothetical protein